MLHFRAFLAEHIVGVHYTVRIFIGSSILWIMLHNHSTSDSLWAIISLIVVTEPHVKVAWLAFRARTLNTLMGCAVGFFFLVWFGPRPALLTPAIGASALLATYLNRVQQGWRIAPVTTALILSSAMTQHSADEAISLAIHRIYEVFLGSAMAVAVTWVMAQIWLPTEAVAALEPAKPKAEAS